jgi:multimeric flavodoxin WrbA
MKAPRALVVYYSRTGHTRIVAEALRSALGADVEEIHDPVERGGVLGYLRCGAEALLGASSQIDLPRKDPSTYDLVLVGGPVWGTSVSSPIRTYLWLEHARLPATALFVTYGGAGSGRALAQMSQLVGKRPVAVLAIREAETGTGKYEPKLAAFVEELLERSARPRRRRRSGRPRAA